jgi:hypothetical protein
MVLAILLLLGVTGSAQAEVLSGKYYGVDAAAGASIELRPDPDGYIGTFFDAKGKSQDFKADNHGGTAEAVLGMDGGTVLMRVVPLPYGAEVTLVPFDGNGNLEIPRGRRLSFVRIGLTLPQPGPDFINPPRDDRGRVTANGFLASYQFWDPTGVRNGYLSLADRSRTVIRLFPAVQLDVIWKLCLAPGADRALSIALRGQGVACDEVIETFAKAQLGGGFERFKDEVGAESAVLRLTVRCTEGYPESKPACDGAARDLARQAVSLDTAATVLSRYR